MKQDILKDVLSKVEARGKEFNSLVSYARDTSVYFQAMVAKKNKDLEDLKTAINHEINILPKVFYKMKYDKKVLDFKFIIVNKKGVVLNTISRESFEKFKKDNPKTLLTKVR